MQFPDETGGSARPFVIRKNSLTSRWRVLFCPVFRPLRNRPFHTHRPELLSLGSGKEAKRHGRVRISLRRLPSRSKFAASAWPGRGFLLPFVRIQGCSMGRLERTLSWWDQEVDRAGRRIRSDVRSAAHEVWAEACRWTQTRLADPAQVADLMEGSVAQVSRYLDRIGAPLSSRKNGLLLLAYSRALRRLAAKSSRLEPIGGAVELSNRAVDHGWSRQLNARLDLENLVRKLSERNSTVLALRSAGYEWKEIADLLGTSVALVRNSFWREVRRKLSKPSPCS